MAGSNYDDRYAEEDGLDGGQEESSGWSTMTWVWIILAVVLVVVLIVVIVVWTRKKADRKRITKAREFGVPEKGTLEDTDSVKFMQRFEERLAELRRSTQENIKMITSSTTSDKKDRKQMDKNLQKNLDATTQLSKDAREVLKRVPDAFAGKPALRSLMAKVDEQVQVIKKATKKGGDKARDELLNKESELRSLDTELDTLIAALNNKIGVPALNNTLGARTQNNTLSSQVPDNRSDRTYDQQARGMTYNQQTQQWEATAATASGQQRQRDNNRHYDAYRH